MSVSLKQSYDVEYNGTVNVSRMDLFVDTAADLTGLTTYDSITLLQGSTAEDISTGDKYAMQTNGTWVKQPSQSAFANVYTKAEIDSMLYMYYTKAEADALFEWITVTITTDTLPLSFISDGSPLTAWSISGNGVQDGTPTPDNPVMPTFCGVRTANLLLPKTNHTETFFGVIIEIDGAQNIKISGTASNSGGRTIKLSDTFMLPAGTYTFGISQSINGLTVYLNDSSNTSVVGTSFTRSFTISEDTEVYFGLNVISGQTYNSTFNIRLNEGSTPEPYEPYGYKIPLTCAGQTTPVYLGQVSTVRKVRKQVLTGTENVELNAADRDRLIAQAVYTLPYTGTTTATNILCSHLPALNSGAATSLQEGIAMRYNGTDILFGLSFSLIGATTDDTNSTIRTKVNSYLAEQYAAGTPVTVWYVLAEPTTGIVNEPLCKIGDYADELNSTDTTVSIPTIKGQNTLTVGTTLQPSEITITGKIREVTENEQ